ncbi:MAG: DUF4430 domain-containing protein [Candidatus Bathyarchaeia archaeon]
MKVKAYRGVVLPVLLASLALITILLVYIHPWGGPSGSASEIHVRLIVSRDFGSTVILDETLTLEEDTTALEALRIASEVETTYGGGFVTSIDGFKRGERDGVQVDWLYYINGLLASVGAADYILRDGDVERWDLHPWASLSMASALIGDYPEPFLHGYDGDRWPTLILYSEDFRGEAEDLRGHLSGLGVKVHLRPVSEAIMDGDGLGGFNLIIIGYFTDSLPSKLNGIHDRLGYYAYYDEDGGVVNAVDWKGGLHSFAGELSLIQASRNPWSPEGTSATSKVAWLIAGTSAGAVGSAVEALIEGRASNLHGLLIVDGGCEPLPLSPGEEG